MNAKNTFSLLSKSWKLFIIFKFFCRTGYLKLNRLNEKRREEKQLEMMFYSSVFHLKT